MERLVEELQEPKESTPKKTRKQSTQVLTPEEPPVTTKPARSSISVATTGPAQRSPSYPPSPASSSSRTTRPYYAGASEGTVGVSGQCSLFSIEGITKIDTLVGDKRFSEAVRALLRRIRSFAPQRSLNFASSPRDYPFPPNDVIIGCMNDFFRNLNHGIRLLQENKVRSAVHAYMYGQPCNEPGWRLALNVILVHSMRSRDWAGDSKEYEHYLNNALALIPNAILETPNPMTIGALLSLAMYFIFEAENHIAISILAFAIQFILLAGYHNPDHPFKSMLSEADILHRRRLFWQAYVLDHDLMLRIGKPPLITDDFLIDLPEEFPLDGYAVYYFPGNVTLSYFHQQVRLSRIQGHIYSKLYSQSGSIVSAAALEHEIAQLDAELQEWREGIPEMIRPEPSMDLVDADYNRMMCLSVLHFMYFQMVVAIHSAAFRLPLLDEEQDSMKPSVALCVNAARATIALLRHQRLSHPFTIYLLYQVAWSVDILFVNILENRTQCSALQDLELIKMILEFFESYDANHQKVASYHIIKVLYEVASSVVVGLAEACTLAPPTTTTAPIPYPQPLGTETAGGIGVPPTTTTSPLMMSGLEFGGDWGNISLGGHDWMTAGFLQMAEWGLPVNPQSVLQPFPGAEPPMNGDGGMNGSN
ncbi:fungal specific transcription factor [Colletotrichum karsti]|uniref:Fungal specific transcription factor n=1 Tax=Colletotrichum karsti TaxID=1095194 RepID=A0A9P6LN79_9PEZI|nr:fungal specific transcription factor [Colletotrichum karsti]KAF9882254.1 fungal specific transcription factor [Colletotrichum karsti]